MQWSRKEDWLAIEDTYDIEEFFMLYPTITDDTERYLMERDISMHWNNKISAGRLDQPYRLL
jgi:hypothetical protein